MAFFNSAVGVLQTLVVALGAGLGMQSGQRQRSLPSVSGWRTPNGNVPSISPRRSKSPAVMCRSTTAYEPKQEVEAGMGVLPGREWQAAV